MKLFKKLAAAVLVAALALMMVGCGSKTGLAQQVKNAVSDDAVMRNEQATNSKDLDALAAKLLSFILPSHLQYCQYTEVLKFFQQISAIRAKKSCRTVCAAAFWA